jgi:hypothetical protein
MKIKIIAILILVIVLADFTGCSNKNLDMRYAMNRNVCKRLAGTTLLYVIFVDTKATKPWTGFDIRSTLDSLQLAINWIQDQAQNNGKSVKLQLEYFHHGETYTISKELPKKMLYESVKAFTDNQGTKKINTWANNISKKTLISFPETTTFNKLLTAANSNPNKPLKPSDTEKLIIALKEKYKTDNIAVGFMLNNYYKNDISLNMNMLSNLTPEYFINSYKNPTLITQQILNLFGALNLYKSPKDETKLAENDPLINRDFPNEIMLMQENKHLSALIISPITQYLLGWTNTVDHKYNKVFKRDFAIEN